MKIKWVAVHCLETIDIGPSRLKQILTNMFACAYNIPMQSNKAPKKTRKIADEQAMAVPEIGAEATASKPRSAKSSKSKKAETADMGLANHQHKTSSASTVELPRTEIAPAGKAIAAAASAGTASGPQGVSSTPITHEEIARLAYSYWAARGYTQGSAQADWLRAEQELRAGR